MGKRKAGTQILHCPESSTSSGIPHHLNAYTERRSNKQSVFSYGTITVVYVLFCFASTVHTVSSALVVCGDDVATVGLNLDSQTLQRFSSGLCCYGDGWFGNSILASVWQFIFIFLVLFSDHQPRIEATELINPNREPL